MSLIDRFRRIHDATHWTRLSHDTHGRGTYDAPAAMKCRWDDAEEEFLLPNGDKSVSRAVVYPETEVKIGDLLMRGGVSGDTVTTYAELLAMDDSNPQWEGAGVFTVRQTKKIDNLRGTKTLFICYL